MSAAIAEAETRWARAIITHDQAALEALIHPTFLYVGLRSAGLKGWNRADWIAATRRIQFQTLEHRVRDLQVFGNTAVATVDGTWKAMIGEQAVDERFLMTDVWMKQPNGAWKVVRRHSTRYIEDAAGMVSEAAPIDLS